MIEALYVFFMLHVSIYGLFFLYFEREIIEVIRLLKS